jgi:hypothetical protein
MHMYQISKPLLLCIFKLSTATLLMCEKILHKKRIYLVQYSVKKSIREDEIWIHAHLSITCTGALSFIIFYSLILILDRTLFKHSFRGNCVACHVAADRLCSKSAVWKSPRFWAFPKEKYPFTSENMSSILTADRWNLYTIINCGVMCCTFNCYFPKFYLTSDITWVKFTWTFEVFSII